MGEEGVGFVKLRSVRGGRVVAGVELEGTDGKEGVIGGEALRVRVKDGNELGKFVLARRDAEGAGDVLC